MVSFLIASGIGIVLILICVAIFYEVLAHVWVNLPRLEGRPRAQILLTVFATFFAHTVAVWLFGSIYYVLDKFLHFGTLKGADAENGFLSYVYFSGVTYSSLGLGDIYPTGGLQLLIGVEAILGLLLIGWTVTFTYLVTEKYLFHRRNPHR
ncbi:MAG: ion channel [Pseudomonadota bacterium]